MGLIKTNAIVIKETIVGESNKQITVLSEEHGKMLLFAKGAKNTKSKLLAGTELFSYGEFSLFEGANFFTVSQINVIESFYAIRNDIMKLTYGTLMLEIIEKTVFSSMESHDLILLLLRSLWALDKTDKNPKLIFDAFAIKLMDINGILADCSECLTCNKNLSDNLLKTYYNFSEFGFICEDCKSFSINSIPVSSGTFSAVNYILNADINKLFSFNAEEKILDEIYNISINSLEIYGDFKLNTVKFLKLL